MQQQRCEACGNEYTRAFMITMNGAEHIFDSFECAIRRLAPKCTHCGTQIIGHGMEENDQIFCCADCAKATSALKLRDHID